MQFEVSDCTKREFQSARFDAVYSRDTILHIEDKKISFHKNTGESSFLKQRSAKLLDLLFKDKTRSKF